jgi:hypothetical protein
MNHNLCQVHNANYARWMKILFKKPCIQKINIQYYLKSKTYIQKKIYKNKQNIYLANVVKGQRSEANVHFMPNVPHLHKTWRAEVPCHSLKYKQQQQWRHHTNTTIKKTWTIRSEGTLKKITMVPNDHDHEKDTNRMKTW